MKPISKLTMEIMTDTKRLTKTLDIISNNLSNLSNELKMIDNESCEEEKDIKHKNIRMKCCGVETFFVSRSFNLKSMEQTVKHRCRKCEQVFEIVL